MAEKRPKTEREEQEQFNRIREAREQARRRRVQVQRSRRAQQVRGKKK